MLMLNKRITALSFLSTFAVLGLSSSQAGAQETTTADDTTVETTVATDTDTDTDSWEGSSDFTGSGSWPGSNPSWIPSGAPVYGYVSCPNYQHSPWPEPFPGGSGGGFPGEYLENDLLRLGYRCTIEGNYGLVRYSCQCGDLVGQEQQGQLSFDWFNQRPTPEMQQAGCEEIFNQQCGNPKVAAKSECQSVYGSCQTAVVNASGSSVLNHNCECLDQTGWGIGAYFDAPLNLNGAALRNHCEAELSLCGIEPTGEGINASLGLGPARSSKVGCASSFGVCFLNRAENGEQEIACECENGATTAVKGDLGWPNPNTDGLLEICSQELTRCAPGGGAVPNLGSEAQAQGTTGAGMPDMSTTGTGGGQAAPAGAEAPVQISCSLGGGSGRTGLALMSLGLLLGLRRRRRS